MRPRGAATLLALLDETAFPMVTAFRDEEEPARFQVVAMWICAGGARPGHRPPAARGDRSVDRELWRR